MDAAERDRRFLNELEAHRKILYKVAHLYGAQPEDRQDLMQEIVVQLWRAYPRFDRRSAFSTWMYRIALNVALSHCRARTRRTHRAAPLDDSITVAALPDPWEDERDTLRRLLITLPELDRALIMLHLDGHDHGEIAAILGTSATNVGTRLNRIKQRLRKELE